jgi:hypothetical protein
MSASPQAIWHMLIRQWEEVAEETVRCLGDESASLFVPHLYLDGSDIIGAISNSYPDEERLHSLVFIEFIGLLKELNTLHVLFLSGNYPVVLRQLRFNWERLFRARYADAYAEENPGAADVPGPTLGEKHEWLTQREGGLNWRNPIAPILHRLFAAGTPADVESLFHPLWDRLNRCVHPTGELREMLTGDSCLHALDAFDEELARATLTDAAEVFGLIWLATLTRFPGVVPALLAEPTRFRACPQLRAVLERAVASA